MRARAKERAGFCHFWRISPAEAKQLTSVEYDEMVKYMKRYHEAQKKANRR